ncbi:Hypothetical protein, putative [Bodo saltans]|uniref:AB hydrolase-1 domain-containing protein n=1 Tax=Bodo saltans TaxID=75058 RepID=A0A0S4J5R4_BODSA|nr:Hypothetical protein, putative [Bodo saltans]|eukprot:CUG86779.1 Hypothetical protein, putative [Bodo saltans]
MPRPIPCVFVPPPPQSPAGGDALLVVHFHGKGGDAWTSGGVWFDAAQRASSQHNLPVAVLSVEYPGYGIFPGRSSEEVWKFTGDAVMSYLLNSLRIPPQRIIVSGRSMGAGVATHVASTRTTISPVSTAYLGLVLISPFTSIHGALQSFPLGITFLSRMLKDRFDNIAAIRNVPSQTQLLVVHGAKDTLIYPSQGMEICKSATHLHETFVLDPEADHHNMPGLVSALEAFVTNVRGNAQMLRTTNCDSWVTQLQSLAISPDRVEELNAAELAEQRKLRRLREVAIGSSVAWSIALPTLPSRLLLVCWSAMLFGLGLIHKQKTEKNARGEWNNKVFGVLSTSTRYAIVTVACRLVFPIMLARRGCVMSAIAISYITHLFLR